MVPEKANNTGSSEESRASTLDCALQTYTTNPSGWQRYIWTTHAEYHARALTAQQNLLKILPTKFQGFVKIKGQDPKNPDPLYINTLLIDNSIPGIPAKTVVLTHGYGAGLGFFYSNYPGISEGLAGYKIYGMDWLGMGNSSRPSFKGWNPALDERENVQLAENFFTDSLESWRKSVGIDRMILAGHSLGGYLSVAYTERYPDRVEKLILISPAGVGLRTQPEEITARSKSSWFFSLAVSAWKWDISPMKIVRALSPFGFGNRLVHRYTQRRFAHLGPIELKDFHEYFFNITAQSGSGEYALSKLLLPGASARFPLYERIPKLNIPVSFIYGREDWMDYKAALLTAEKSCIPYRIARIADAGHHLYSDNPTAFNKAFVAEVLDEVLPIDHRDIEYVYSSK